MEESFEQANSTNSTFRPVTKGNARAEFDMASTAAASEGTLCKVDLTWIHSSPCDGQQGCIPSCGAVAR
jgi:hypothetical protein